VTAEGNPKNGRKIHPTLLAAQLHAGKPESPLVRHLQRDGAAHPGSEGKAVSNVPTKSIRDLRPSERQFVDAMRRLGHGRFESLRIQRGELVLEPPQTAVRSVKFGKPTPNKPEHPSSAFDLKQEVAQLFEAIRGIDAGEIRVIEVRGGLPFCMEIAE
jgi:hypothetical protein